MSPRKGTTPTKESRATLITMRITALFGIPLRIARAMMKVETKAPAISPIPGIKPMNPSRPTAQGPKRIDSSISHASHSINGSSSWYSVGLFFAILKALVSDDRQTTLEYRNASSIGVATFRQNVCLLLVAVVLVKLYDGLKGVKAMARRVGIILFGMLFLLPATNWAQRGRGAVSRPAGGGAVS